MTKKSTIFVVLKAYWPTVWKHFLTTQESSNYIQTIIIKKTNNH